MLNLASLIDSMVSPQSISPNILQTSQNFEPQLPSFEDVFGDNLKNQSKKDASNTLNDINNIIADMMSLFQNLISNFSKSSQNSQDIKFDLSKIDTSTKSNIISILKDIETLSQDTNPNFDKTTLDNIIKGIQNPKPGESIFISISFSEELVSQSSSLNSFDSILSSIDKYILSNKDISSSISYFSFSVVVENSNSQNVISLKAFKPRNSTQDSKDLIYSSKDLNLELKTEKKDISKQTLDDKVITYNKPQFPDNNPPSQLTDKTQENNVQTPTRDLPNASDIKITQNTQVQNQNDAKNIKESIKTTNTKSSDNSNIEKNTAKQVIADNILADRNSDNAKNNPNTNNVKSSQDLAENNTKDTKTQKTMADNSVEQPIKPQSTNDKPPSQFANKTQENNVQTPTKDLPNTSDIKTTQNTQTQNQDDTKNTKESIKDTKDMLSAKIQDTNTKSYDNLAIENNPTKQVIADNISEDRNSNNAKKNPSTDNVKSSQDVIENNNVIENNIKDIKAQKNVMDNSTKQPTKSQTPDNNPPSQLTDKTQENNVQTPTKDLPNTSDVKTTQNTQAQNQKDIISNMKDFNNINTNQGLDKSDQTNTDNTFQAQRMSQDNIKTDTTNVKEPVKEQSKSRIDIQDQSNQNATNTNEPTKDIQNNQENIKDYIQKQLNSVDIKPTPVNVELKDTPNPIKDMVKSMIDNIKSNQDNIQSFQAFNDKKDGYSQNQGTQSQDQNQNMFYQQTPQNIQSNNQSEPNTVFQNIQKAILKEAQSPPPIYKNVSVRLDDGTSLQIRFSANSLSIAINTNAELINREYQMKELVNSLQNLGFSLENMTINGMPVETEMGFSQEKDSSDSKEDNKKDSEPDIDFVNAV